MTLAITGGRFKGISLRTPKGQDLTRPTSGKVRQALFNILRGRVEESDFLDLYAGSGAVGLEALSRGCRSVTCVENHPAAFRPLVENCRLLIAKGADPAALKWVQEDAEKFCQAAAKRRHSFGTIFVDPPFSQDFSGILQRIAPIINAEGVAIVQFPSRKPPDFTVQAERVYAYGESSLAVFAASHF